MHVAILYAAMVTGAEQDALARVPYGEGIVTGQAARAIPAPAQVGSEDQIAVTDGNASECGTPQRTASCGRRCGCPMAPAPGRRSGRRHGPMSQSWCPRPVRTGFRAIRRRPSARRVPVHDRPARVQHDVQGMPGVRAAAEDSADCSRHRRLRSGGGRFAKKCSASTSRNRGRQRATSSPCRAPAPTPSAPPCSPFWVPEDWRQEGLRSKVRSPLPALRRMLHGHVTLRQARPHLPEALWRTYFTIASSPPARC